MAECNDHSSSMSGNARLMGSQTSLATRHYVPPRLNVTNVVEWWSDLKNSRKIATFMSIFLFCIVIFAILLITKSANGVERQNIAIKQQVPEQHHFQMNDELNQVSKSTQQNLVEHSSAKSQSSLKSNSPAKSQIADENFSQKFLELDKKISDLKEKVNFLTAFQNHTSDLLERLVSLEKAKQRMEFKEKLGSMITQPLAFLYTERNQKGRLFTYNEEGSESPGCMNLSSNVKSVDTMGSCIRLFTKPNCFGFSLPFFTGSPRHHEDFLVSDEVDGFNSVNSVGPCLVNELDGATIKVIPWKNMEVNVFHKARHSKSGSDLDSLVIPDLLYSGRPAVENSKGKMSDKNSDEHLDFEFSRFSSEEAAKHILRPQGRNSGPILSSTSSPSASTSTLTRNLGGSISMSHRGHGGRIEYLETIDLNLTHLLQDWESEEKSLFFNSQTISFSGSYWVTNQVKNFFDSLDKKSGDQLGLAIGLKLGGPRDVPANVYPQSRANLKSKAALEFKVISRIRKSRDSNWRIEVNFDYANSTITRPSGLTYRLNKVETNSFQSFYLSNF